MIENPEKKTIESVVSRELCTGCGTCDALCPKKAIKLGIDKTKGVYVPRINKDICNNCGFCYDVCSGYKVEYNKVNQEIYGKEPENILIGNYQNCYTAYSRNTKIRYNSSSGGLITQLLIYALEKEIITGALVTRMNKCKPLEPEPFIARTKEEIIEASKSKYCPVPVNIVLREILESKEEEKFAVVGLPCHINGIRIAENKSKKLKNKIVLHLGIFCNHTPNFHGTDLYLKKLNIKKEDVKKIDYRGEGWPGTMKIITLSGTSKISDYWGFIGSYFFYPKRCLMCGDCFCEIADISFGDAWLPELKGDKVGRSMIISRSEIGESILQKMSEENYIELNRISSTEVIQSQTLLIYLKKKNFTISKSLLKIYPQNKLLHSDPIDDLIAFWFYFNISLSSNHHFKAVLHKVPLKIIKVYCAIFNKFALKKARKEFKSQYNF
jgi:coenzyme F420 hydrogenase subunit beta